MDYEKTQKGNPHNLTVNQHVFPTRSIERFYARSGRVECKLIPSEKIISIKATNKLFSTRRKWDQRAESGYMKTIEDSFQTTVEELIQSKSRYLNIEQNFAISRFFSLWYARTKFYKADSNDLKLERIVQPFIELDKDEEEQLEKSGK